MSSLFATQVTAVATGVLAVFAIITATLAGMAFRKQSQEVTLLRVQLKDQEELGESQVAVFELQATELAQSLEERRLNREQRHRAQANRVFIWEDRRLAGTVIAHVKNASAQPIYDVEVSWDAGSTVCVYDRFDQPLMPADERVSSSGLNVPDAEDPTLLCAALWFRDAAGTSWRARPDGIAEEVPPGEEPPRAL